jgi:phospholipid transport system substrate-binding protein
MSPTVRALLCLVALLAAPPAVASVTGGQDLNPPQRVIQGVSEDLMRVLQEDRDLLRTDPAYVHRLVDRLLLPNLDFSRVAALVLGPHWREASPSQRQAFEREFKTLLIQTYASALDRLSTWELRYPPMRLDPGQTRALVRTELRQAGGAFVAVDYRMAVTGDRWVAYDVLVEGVSLLSSYRAQFTEIARRRGIDGLLAELSARNATRR